MEDKTLLRKLLIDILNDDNGVSEKVYDSIVEICTINGWADIIGSIEGTDGRFYISEFMAERLQQT